MKHHKEFRRALLVSIQERQAQYPEMADVDFEKALRMLADQSARDRYKRSAAERAATLQARVDAVKAHRAMAEASEWAKLRATDRAAWAAGAAERARLAQEECVRPRHRKRAKLARRSSGPAIRHSPRGITRTRAARPRRWSG